MEHLPHLSVSEIVETLDFTSSGMGREKSRPQRSRSSHSSFLRSQLNAAWRNAGADKVIYHTAKNGIYLEFEGEVGFELATKSLESLRGRKENWTRLLNIRKEKQTLNGVEEETTFATLYVPNSKRESLFKKIEKYATGDNPKSDTPPNAALLETISNIRQALKIESFWLDSKSLIPADTPEWCEIWLSSDESEVIEQFEKVLDENNIIHKPGRIIFPERAVKAAYVTRTQLELISCLSDDIAEYRRAKETAAFWLDQSNAEQSQWAQNILERLNVSKDSKVAICVLDTGVNNRHPLLSPVLQDENCHAVDDEWGRQDHDRHGTLMAGVTAYGNLQEILSHNEIINIQHYLESVKILPLTGENQADIWGYITAQGLHKAEVQAPDKKRIACMAISAEDARDMGRPSSWSGQIDQLCSGSEDGFQRLMIVCAGNTDVFLQRTADYPEPQLANPIHDPGQSWNALTVGAYTDLAHISDKTLSNYSPLAEKGGLSPFSSTSKNWEDRWPIKPEILMEGGNTAKDGKFITECDDLSVLSTYFLPTENTFYPFNMTSAATAKAAWLAAQIQVKYSDYWPETIRALMVHSAKWTPAMETQFLKDESKTSYKNLLRICGYGVPDQEKALFSASNNLTLIAQQEIQPFKKDGSHYKTNDMHFYELPWPNEVLLELPPETEIQMRVTLSYFVEPGPGEIGWKDRYRYASHGLRFYLNSPGEDKDTFIRRVNVAARDEENGRPNTPSASEYWTLGQARDKGSIHSDIWNGSAQDLTTSNLIAVSPVIGWWRERHHLNKWGNTTRYSLIVSISTPEQEVDVYTPVAVELGVPVPTPVEVIV